MKTPRTQVAGLDVAKAASEIQARRKRTLAAIACEPLEGKKLMTGFAGAAGMAGGMMGGPAEMGDMGGVRFRRDGADSFGGDQATTQGQDVAATTDSGDAGQVAASAAGSGQADATTQGGMIRSLRRGDLSRGPSGSFGGDHADLAGRAMGGDLGGAASGVPMAGQGDPSTGNTQLDADLKKLRTDEQAIHDKSQVTPALQAAVRKDLEAIDAAKTGTADATKLQTLQTDQKTILGGATKPTDAQQAQLQADQDAVLLSQGVSQALIDQLAADRLAVKTATNFTADDQATLDADHAAIKADMTPAAATSTDASTTAAAAATPTADATTAAPTADVGTNAAATVATTTTAATTTVSPAVPINPDGTAAATTTGVATATTGSAATPAPFSSHPMIPAVAPTGGNFASALTTHSTSTAASTRGAGGHGGIGFGHHAGQNFESTIQGAGGFGGGRVRRAARG